MILLNPWTVFTGIILGCLTGLFFPAFARNLKPLGDIFLSLLQMCIIPILITAVISSLGKLLKTGGIAAHIGKIGLLFASGLFLASLLGLCSGSLLKPGNTLNDHDRMTLGKLIVQSEIKLSAEKSAGNPDLLEFFKTLIPSNIFEAFSAGQNLGILFFCILLGLALGFGNSESSQTALSVTEALYDAFLKLIGWIMYFMPFGLYTIFASEISRVGLDILHALMKFILTLYAASLALMFLYHCLIWWKKGGSFLQPFHALRETFVVALGTSSSFASIPSALRCLQNNLKVDRKTANLVIPLGVNLNPQGSVLHFALSTVFIAQIYGTAFTPQHYFLALTGAVFAGLAATGMPGAGSLSMLSLILTPLGLPGQAAVIFLVAIDPIVDPILTTVNIHSCTTVAVLVEKNTHHP